MSNLKDFVIKDGVLVKYTGNDTDVVIHDGVTKMPIVHLNIVNLCEACWVALLDM